MFETSYQILLLHHSRVVKNNIYVVLSEQLSFLLLLLSLCRQPTTYNLLFVFPLKEMFEFAFQTEGLRLAIVGASRWPYLLFEQPLSFHSDWLIDCCSEHLECTSRETFLEWHILDPFPCCGEQLVRTSRERFLDWHILDPSPFIPSRYTTISDVPCFILGLLSTTSH